MSNTKNSLSSLLQDLIRIENNSAEIIAKLSSDKKEVNRETGEATSEFDKFVGGLKQDACEVILKSTATPEASTTPEATSDEGESKVPKTPEEQLPDLVKNKL